MAKKKALTREDAIEKMRKEAQENIVLLAIMTLVYLFIFYQHIKGIMERNPDYSLGFIERNGKEMPDTSSAAWTASVSYHIFVAVVTAIFIVLLYFFLRSIKKTGVPFTHANSRLLFALAVCTMSFLIAPVIPLYVYPLVDVVGGTSDSGVTAFGLSFTLSGFSWFFLFLVIGLLFVLARIFRYGVFLQVDDEGLI